ncbi:unnamed protein product [Nesidiocoris tenuis]|uniref:Uncharacterized protein n=1 Tax=Nesidiocoris tenuis TaxID=355587 RepID=A0A6H5HK85_9HEMI|nr:unnamed protein product [Nesidiocoris tenuis]
MPDAQYAMLVASSCPAQFRGLLIANDNVGIRSEPIRNAHSRQIGGFLPSNLYETGIIGRSDAKSKSQLYDVRRYDVSRKSFHFTNCLPISTHRYFQFGFAGKQPKTSGNEKASFAGNLRIHLSPRASTRPVLVRGFRQSPRRRAHPRFERFQRRRKLSAQRIFLISEKRSLGPADDFIPFHLSMDRMIPKHFGDKKGSKLTKNVHYPDGRGLPEVVFEDRVTKRVLRESSSFLNQRGCGSENMTFFSENDRRSLGAVLLHERFGKFIAQVTKGVGMGYRLYGN